MKQYINVIGLLSFLFFWVSCTDETGEKNGDIIEGIPTTVSVSFGIPTVDKIETRSEIDKSEENSVYNLIVFVFKKVGSEWKKEISSTQLIGGNADSEGSVTGEVSLTMTSGEKRIYAVANGIDNPLMPVESLESVTTLDELLSLVAAMQQGSIERGQSHLLMSGMFDTEDNVDGRVVVGPEENNKTLSSGTIRLKHLDSKIIFIVTTKPGISFIAKEWKVYNVPYSSYVFVKPYSNSNTLHDAERDYFDSSWANFEKTIEGDISKGGSFAFYMLENRKAGLGDIVADATKAGVDDPYQLREKQKKEPTDQDKVVTNGDYIYAPKHATYVEMTGSFHQEPVNGEGEKRAEVKYTIHLGYENKEADNFRIRRGCDYTYNVKVTGVRSIEMEVETSDQDEPIEKQPGAEGDVVKSLTYLYVDAHYVTKSIVFSKANVSDDASFRVKTPYDSNGIGDAATDYEWVWFVQNKKEQKQGRWIYKQGDANFVPYVAEEYNTGSPNVTNARRIHVKDLIPLLQNRKEDAPGQTSIYDSEGNACFTVFIDEFYYKDRAAAWTGFTNVANREMHILCDTRYSQDQESSLTTSNFLISQKSIKTFYDASAPTAWGVETIREGEPLAFDDKKGENLTNGRLNMSSYMRYVDQNWSKYVNSLSNTLTSVYNKVAYACMQRNRDLNGDSKISNNEVKWYLPALNQMVGMWIGRDGYPSMEVYLFNGDPSKITNEAGRRQYHFMNSNYTMFWAEEGASIGNWSIKDHRTLDYRCVRNLGVWSSDTHGDKPETEPLDYVQYDAGTRIFDLSRMNNKAIRTERYTGEIAVDNELSQVNRPYKYFKIARNMATGTVTQSEIYNDRKSPCRAYSEESGGSDSGTWRMPNQRELSLINAYANNEQSVSRTRSSLKMKEKNNYGSVFYQIEDRLITLNQDQGGTSFKVRCVKDIAKK